MTTRKLLMEYGVAVWLSVLFAMVLGQVPLFRDTMVGKLHASDIVQFVGYGGALVMAWLGARRLAAAPPEGWIWLRPFQALVLPVATLVAVSVLYGVALLIMEPVLGKSWRAVYNWCFIAGIVSSCGWCVLSWMRRCAPLVAELDLPKLRRAA